ncbi:transmembrane amino acid transporter protein-domain-containing protein, partial [Ochromonadaceae sp. CCMP2298]
WAQDRHIWVFIGFCVVAPLCCLRNLDSLRFTSTASLGFVVFLTLLVVLFASNVPSLDPCQSVADDDVCVGRTANAIVDMTTGKVISIFIFGYTCQQNIFSSVNEMKQPTPGRINAVVATSIFVAMSIYLIVAACGYHTYGASVDPDILVNYPETSFVSVARLAVSLLVAFSYPLQCHPSRRSILTLLSTYLDKPAEDNVSVASSAVAPSIETQAMRYTVVTACFLGLSLLIGLTVTNLGTVLALVGATGSTTVSYILPGFFYFFLFENKGPAWKRYLALAQGIIGLIIVPVCLTFIFL